MKLATLKDGTRDGQLLLVSRDLHTAVIADAIVPTMQRLMEDWSFYAPQLHAVYEALNSGRVRRAFGFEAKDCMAPLPRTYRLALHGNDNSNSSDEKRAGVTDGNGDQNAVNAQACRTIRGDFLLAGRDDIKVEGTGATLDFHSGLGVLLSDVTAGTHPARAADSIRLLTLSAAFHPQPGSGTHSRTTAQEDARWCAFSPVAVTPDEFGQHWQDRHLKTPLAVQVNGRHAPTASTRALSEVDVGLLVAALAQQQDIAAGTVLLSAPVSHVASEWLIVGDRIRVDALDVQGASICGAIEQSIAPHDE